MCSRACGVHEARGVIGNMRLLDGEGRAVATKPEARAGLWADEAGDLELLSILVSSPALGLGRGPET